MWDWMVSKPVKKVSHPTLSLRYDSVVGVFYRWAIAAERVQAIHSRVISLAHFINMNSAHGYFEQSTSLKKHLGVLKESLKRWRARYKSATLDLIEYSCLSLCKESL